MVNGVSYNAANQLLAMTFGGIGETRGYNVLNQLTSITAGSSENLAYNYPTGNNNGKISSMYNYVSGENITYAYDSLNRLIAAQGTGWGEQYGFDSFGNLLSKTVTAGSGPSLSVTVNPANNQIQGVSGLSYDANGNQSVASGGGYDAENRFVGYYDNGNQYAYDAQNRRIWNWSGTLDTYGNATSYTLIAYSPSGQRLGAYSLAPYPNLQNGTYSPYLQVTLSTSDEYFGSRRLAVIDQLGSAGTYFPWGEDKGSTNPQNAWSFATYWRDSGSGLDYANNRYYSNAYGRFMTPDPSRNRGQLNDPQSWNHYVYTRGDPVNRFDPLGTDDCAATFADASQPYDPYSSCSGAGGYSCPGWIMNLEYDPDGATFYAQAAAMGCASASATEVAQGGPQAPQPECYVEIRYTQITNPVPGVSSTPFNHTMLVGIEVLGNTQVTLGVIDGWASAGVLAPPFIGVLPQLTSAETPNGHYGNANTAKPYVDSTLSAAMCALWNTIVSVANNLPGAIYGVGTSNSNSLTTYLWGLLGQSQIGPPPGPQSTPGWNDPIMWFPFFE